jgi:hypothetical protein
MIELIKVSDNEFQLTVGNHKLLGDKNDTVIRLEGYGCSRFDIQEVMAHLNMGISNRVIMDSDINEVFKGSGRFDN